MKQLKGVTISGITELANELHYNYGKGEILRTRVFLDGKVEIDAQRTSCKPHTAVGRVDGNTVRMYRHQRTWRISK